jgi:hypothetical protein
LLDHAVLVSQRARGATRRDGGFASFFGCLQRCLSCIGGSVYRILAALPGVGQRGSRAGQFFLVGMRDGCDGGRDRR